MFLSSGEGVVLVKAELWAVLVSLLGAFLGALGQLFFKVSSKSISFKPSNWFSILKNYRFVLALFLYGVATLLGLAALRGGELSLIYPLISTSFVWVALLAKKYLGEEINSWKWSGIFLILAGVFLLML